MLNLILTLPVALLLFLSSLYFSTATQQRFGEAPAFYNSPDCPSVRADTVLDHDHGPGNVDSAMCCADAAVHVAMTLDSSYLRGSVAAVHSILHHSSCPQNIAFHFISSRAAALAPSLLASTVSASFPYLNFRIYPFDDRLVEGLISASIRPSLDLPLNYALSYLSVLFPPCVHKVVYLDSDTILVDHITDLAAIPLRDGAEKMVLAAPEYPELSLTFSDRKRAPCYFNTGMMVIDLDQWREGEYTKQIEEWMEVQKKMRIYELGSLPPFLLVFAGRIRAVNHRWNQHGLGGDNYQRQCRDLHPGPASLLHWSGKGKPWVRIDENRACPLDALWASYDLLQSPF